jgi:hypothetical protein
MKKFRKRPFRRHPHPDQIRQYIGCMITDHEKAWSEELHSQHPEWIYLLGLHLRLAELEHLEPAAQEFL